MSQPRFKRLQIEGTTEQPSALVPQPHPLQLEIEQMRMNIQSLRQMQSNRQKECQFQRTKLARTRALLQNLKNKFSSLQAANPRIHFREQFILHVDDEVSKINKEDRLSTAPAEPPPKPVIRLPRRQTQQLPTFISAVDNFAQVVQRNTSNQSQRQALQQQLNGYQRLLQERGISGLDRLFLLAQDLSTNLDDGTIGYLTQQREKLIKTVQQLRQKRLKLYDQKQPQQNEADTLKDELRAQQRAIRKLREADRARLDTALKLQFLMRSCHTVSNMSSHQRQRLINALQAMRLG